MPIDLNMTHRLARNSKCHRVRRDIPIYKRARTDDRVILDGYPLRNDSLAADVATIPDPDWSTLIFCPATRYRPLHRIMRINMGSRAEGARVPNHDATRAVQQDAW